MFGDRPFGRHKIALVPASRQHIPIMDTFIRASAADDRLMIGYPRCDDVGELLAELNLYHTSLEQSIRIIVADGCLVGFTGVLQDDDTGYVIGPILDERVTSAPVATAVLGAVEDTVRNEALCLSNSVCKSNRALYEAHCAAGWHAGHDYVEMKWDAGTVVLKASSLAVTEIRGVEDQRFDETCEVLQQAFGWQDAQTRLTDLINEHYHVVCRTNNGSIVGCAIWAPVQAADFARLEYVAVADHHRGKGIASALVQAVQVAAGAAGVKCVYLSVDADNCIAQRLYEKNGFRETVQSTVFTKQLHRAGRGARVDSEPKD